VGLAAPAVLVDLVSQDLVCRHSNTGAHTEHRPGLRWR
jgi:hypothetical protein